MAELLNWAAEHPWLFLLICLTFTGMANAIARAFAATIFAISQIGRK